MRLHMQNNIKIARRSAVDARIALLLVAHARAILNSRWHVDLHGALPHLPAFAFAFRARIGDHAPHSAAIRTGARHAEEALLITDLPAPAAGGTSHRTFARSRARSVALLATFIAPDSDFGLFAESCFFKSQIQVRTRVSALLCPVATARTHVDAKEIADKVAKDVAEIGER